MLAPDVDKAALLINSMNRRSFLLTTAITPFTVTAIVKASERKQRMSTKAKLMKLESLSGGQLGVCAVNSNNKELVGLHSNKRFPVCSTFKVLLAAAILAQSVQNEELLERRIHYKQRDLVTYSPISEKHIKDGMTIFELCAAALQYSDNTSANLLMKILGGPSAVTAYARSIGNTEFRLDRWETELNTCIPGDPRDTATPASMAHSLRSLTLGTGLPPAKTKQLNEWLQGNTTGAKRIRAATPAGWQIGDKTGSGDYGTTNDIAVLWSPEHVPIVLAIYYTQQESKARWRDDVIASATRIVLDDFQ